MALFTNRSRTDRSPKKANETPYGFLDRCALPYFEPIRELLETWLSAVPVEHLAGMVGNLKAEDASFESAFWELYLYTAATGSGEEVEIHPSVPGSTKRPDFLIHATQTYYLEAIAVGKNHAEVAADRRLDDVYTILDQARVDGFTLWFECRSIGKQALGAKQLRVELLKWAATLDPSTIELASLRGRNHLHVYTFDDGGWQLEFAALPVTPGRPGGSPLIGIRGRGGARMVDNKTGLRRALDSKANRYGQNLPYPLITAVLSNTEIPTQPYDISSVLYGLHVRPPRAVQAPTELAEEGHWRGRTGWRRPHNPQVIVGAGLHLYSMARNTPTLWTTVQENIATIDDISWADPVDVHDTDPQSAGRPPALQALGISADWCALPPDFRD